ncbi:sensor histidine kinase [Pedobacter caeni]|uniref:histidine kinase n=1 Tax=Pedobacter caeni TaxID=288992 RepID=A0A1M5JSL7_9SPHI|nr:PAS domain-containing sensor histidine kinase [Pedobacter caeni]SHG43541.1 PAS domain S-box-containing protein [Pedobacter caeni]
MISLNEQLFESVFNYATFPMVVLNAGDADFTIITHNKEYQVIFNDLKEEAIGLDLLDVLKNLVETNDLDLLRIALTQSASDKTAVQLPVFQFMETQGQAELKKSWRLEVVPVSKSNEGAICLLLIWHSLNQQLSAYTDKMAPGTLPERQLALTGEKIETGNEELETATGELEAINEELVQTQEALNKLSEDLDEKVEAESGNSNRQQGVAIQRDRLRRFLMQAPAGICVLGGPDLIFELVNPSFQELFPGRILLGERFIKALPEIKEQPMWDLLQDVYTTGETFHGTEMQILDRYFNFIYQARFDANDQIDGVLVFVYEVTEMVMVRLEVEENEKRFRLLLNGIPQIAWTNTPDGKVNFYNEQWYRYTGTSLEESLGLGLQDVVFGKDLKHHREEFRAILESKESGHYELRLKGSDEEYKWYLIRMQPIKGDAEEILLWIGTATDIHELKMLQQQKDDFISIASHELKTPVASLKASMQLLDRMKHNSSEKMQSLISMAGKSVDKIGGMIENLLDSSQMAEGGMILKKNTFNLYELVQNCSKGIPVEAEYQFNISGDKNVNVNADAGRIEQVIINMLTNAVKYAPESKQISLHLEKIKDKVKLSVIDKGAGIPAEKIPYLFDRYYRAGESDQPGLGLGLYISSEIIAKHNGEIGAESKGGDGSKFWFTLPLSL